MDCDPETPGVLPIGTLLRLAVIPNPGGDDEETEELRLVEEDFFIFDSLLWPG